MDGFIIGACFAAGGETGPILAIGLSVELLVLGLALTSEAPGGWRIVALSGALGGTVLLFAMLGSRVSHNPERNRAASTARSPSTSTSSLTEAPRSSGPIGIG